MAVNKNFVVKNGIEVATDLIYATSDLDKVGIGSTIPTSTLEVGGDFKATGNSTVVGFATVQDTFEVGVGGTVITADVQAGRIGLNTATAHHNVHISNVGTGDTTLYVDGGDVKVDGNIYADNLGITGDVNAINLNVTGITTLGDSSGADKVDINTSVDLDGDLDVLGVSTFTGAVKVTGDTVITGITSISSNVTVGGGLTVSGITSMSSDVIVGGGLTVSGISTFASTIFVGGSGGSSGAATTDYSEVTTSNLSPTSFNQTYSRQSTGFVLDTDTVSSGNALFHADSNYYYYVATTGTDPDSRMLIWSVQDNNWMTVFDFNGTDFTEGNVTDNQALGFSGIFEDTVTANSVTADGRLVPQPSSDIVYATSGGGGGSGGSGIGVTITAAGNAEFVGIVTAAAFHGDGSNLTGIATELTATIGISSGGEVIGTGITIVDYTATNATITVAVPPDTAAGIATVNITPSVSLGLVIALGG